MWVREEFLEGFGGGIRVFGDMWERIGVEGDDWGLGGGKIG